jgi:pilus assembly protein CpaF
MSTWTDGHLDPALADRVRRRLAVAGGSVTSSRVATVLREEVSGVVSDVALLRLLREAQSEFVGAGPLEPLLAEPMTTDVLVNGPDEVWLDRGCGLERAPVRFADDGAVRRLAQRLAAAAGQRLDDGRPWADGTLPDGCRLHAVLPAITGGRTYLSLRVLRPVAFTLDELIAAGTLTPDCASILRLVTQARLAFLITGGTGSGKTTLLGSLLTAAPSTERVVVVEDAAEIRSQHPHLVRLVARSANVEGVGEVTLRDLVRQALRMRPDRLVVGEVRGAEVVDLLAALNTGHDGGCGTIHANSADELPARVEALGALGGLTGAALHSQLGAAVQVALHLLRRGGRRQLAEIGVVERAGSRVAVRCAWRGGPGPAAGRLADLLAARGVAERRLSVLRDGLR